MVKRGCENQSVTEIRKSMVKNEALLACFVNAWSNATIDLSNFGSEILNQKTCYLIKYLPIFSNDLIFSWNCLKMKPYEMDVSYYRCKNPVWILHKMSNIHLLLDGWKKTNLLHANVKLLFVFDPAMYKPLSHRQQSSTRGWVAHCQSLAIVRVLVS